MTRVVWGAPGARKFEMGTDRGVLYPFGSDGVPWDGLLGVSEAPLGGAPNPRYIDGLKYLNEETPEEYAATLLAINYPKEFAACDGYGTNGTGLIFDSQPRKSFHLTYRTKIGNDTVGVDYGYKLHLVYNCKVAPSSRAYQTTSNSPTPVNYSWGLSVIPAVISGMRPTAHLIVDSTVASAADLLAVENILYGTAGTAPRMATISELVTLFA